MDARDLIAKSGLLKHVSPLVILAGAGISFDEPANVPLANDLTWNVLDELLPVNHRLGDKFAWIAPYGMSCPRLETILEVAVQVFGVSILSPLKKLADITPNRTHRLLAPMMPVTPLITTNLDCGIENAANKGAFLRVVANQSTPN